MVFRVVALTLPVLAVFTLPAVAISVAAAWWYRTPVFTAGHAQTGLFCSLCFWLFLAVRHFRQDRFRVSVSEPAAWLEELRADLEQMGYAVRLQTDRRLVVEPCFSSLLFGEGIGVVVKDGTAVVLGPRLYLARLRAALRTRERPVEAGEITRPVGRIAMPIPRSAPPGPFSSDTLAVLRALQACGPVLPSAELTAPCRRDRAP
jgi:hypothetical protein